MWVHQVHWQCIMIQKGQLQIYSSPSNIHNSEARVSRGGGGIIRECPAITVHLVGNFLCKPVRKFQWLIGGLCKINKQITKDGKAEICGHFIFLIFEMLQAV
jgi:hypothetical protein